MSASTPSSTSSPAPSGSLVFPVLAADAQDVLTAPVAERIVAIGLPDSADSSASADTVYVWTYFAERIDEFAVAKCLVDHFEAHPQDLRVQGLLACDVLGLVLRAKVTIKREQLAYAKAQADAQAAREVAERAIVKAQASSRSVRGWLRHAGSFVGELQRAALANPGALVAAVALTLLLWRR